MLEAESLRPTSFFGCKVKPFDECIELHVITSRCPVDIACNALVVATPSKLIFLESGASSVAGTDRIEHRSRG